MENETWVAKGIRGLVKTVFIGCYIAFLWASIHHVATFFNNFEADSGDVLGSYMLAGAFDITALVTTIGVMFFRKSMPRGIQMVVWGFIIGIAGYSFFINWEYAAHFQNASLVLQATGATMPIYDHSGTLHYVPVMQQNTILLFVNPFLASGFTVFSLIYSIIAEFFGAKPPTIEELQARKIYLEETTMLMASIKQLEGKTKGKGLIQSAKEKALEMKAAVKEVVQSENQTESTDSDEGQSIQADESIQLPNNHQSIQDENVVQLGNQSEVSGSIKEGKNSQDQEKWNGLSGRSTVSLEKSAELLNVSINTIVTLRNKDVLKTAALNRNLITVASLKAYESKRSNRKQSQRPDEMKAQLKVINT